MQPVDPVEFARLQERVSGLTDLKTDVKTILTSVRGIELHLAKTPTWSQLEPVITPLRKDVESLKLSRENSKGAKKALLLVGSTIGTFSGVLGAVLGRIFAHPATASAVQHTSEAAKNISQILK